MAVDESGEISVVEAAIRLGISRERVIRRVQTGELDGRRDELRGWRVSEVSLIAAPHAAVRQPA